MTRFTSTLLSVDDDSGDAILPLPPEVQAALGLKEGSLVDVEIDTAGRLVITPAADARARDPESSCGD